MSGHTPFKDMRDGPVKRIVERELRSLANDIDRMIDASRPSGLSEPAAIRLEGVNHEIGKGIVRLAMQYRGLEPKE